MLLNDVKKISGFISLQGENIAIKNLNLDSRKATEEGLFFCISGTRFDGHLFAPQAVENGNVALVVEKFIPTLNVPQVLVQNARIAMAEIASIFYNEPQKHMKFIGVTGTKGKTTTSYMIKSIFETSGYKVGLIGTTGNMIGNTRYDSRLTTPDPIDLYHMLSIMHNQGVQVVVMEVSAHAIDMYRLVGIEFEVGCYTNFSQDHLDYFGTMDQYFNAKLKFFTEGYVKNAVFNGDDARATQIKSSLSVPYMVYSIGANSDVFARDIEVLETGASFTIHFNEIDELPIHMSMTGNFNVYNALCAATAAMVLNVPSLAIKQGLENVKCVPGRIELLETGTPYKVILDYSHSPDSLENILHAVREFTKNKLILLFGCGGDRDHTKRPIMGEIAGKLADFTIITSDNPRNEQPLQIIHAIEEGCKKHTSNYIIIEDRKQAILHALQIAQDGDIIILAGKGHETYQEKSGVKYPFDEKLIVKELLLHEVNHD